MDTTLRDGEQTSGISFNSAEKLSIARLLLKELKVDRIEIASARVSDGELEGAAKIANWAKQHNHLNQVEVLGFIDKGISLGWILKSGCRVINLLSKGSLNHCTHQLKKSPEEHWQDIAETVEMAQRMGMDVNIYLEDWSNGIIASPEYVHGMMNALKALPIKRFMLPDTLGILNPY
ncbi:MAG: hypothetical protein RR889_07340, partial [Akkermansia sp.]